MLTFKKNQTTGEYESNAKAWSSIETRHVSKYIILRNENSWVLSVFDGTWYVAFADGTRKFLTEYAETLWDDVPKIETDEDAGWRLSGGKVTCPKT